MSGTDLTTRTLHADALQPFLPTLGRLRVAVFREWPYLYEGDPDYEGGSLWSKYSNPDFDREVDAARATLDEAARKEHYKRAFEILRQDVPGIGLFQDVSIYGARAGLQWTPTANEAFFVMDMKWQG